MKQIITAARVEWSRFSTVGSSLTFFAILLGFPLLAVLLVLLAGSRGEFGSGLAVGVTGSESGLLLAMLTTCFMANDGPEGRLYGIMPIRRTNQVLGRYLANHVFPLLMALGLILILFVNDGWQGGKVDVRAALGHMDKLFLLGLAVLAIGIIIIDLCIPLLYRNPLSRAMVKLSIYALGLVFLCLLAARLPLDWKDLFSRVMDFLTASTRRTCLMALLVVLVVDVISKAVSIKAYQDRDL